MFYSRLHTVTITPPNQHGSADILEIFYSVWASECYRAANNLTGINVENVRIENI